MWQAGNVLYRFHDRRCAPKDVALIFVVIDRNYFIGKWQLEEKFANPVYDSEQEAEDYIINNK